MKLTELKKKYGALINDIQFDELDLVRSVAVCFKVNWINLCAERDTE